MYRAPTCSEADSSVPVGMTVGKREKRGRTEVRPYTEQIQIGEGAAVLRTAWGHFLLSVGVQIPEVRSLAGGWQGSQLT